MFKTWLTKLRGSGLDGERQGASIDEQTRSIVNQTQNLETLYPQILPPEAIATHWPGPIEPLGDLPFGLSWAVVAPANVFHFITHELAEIWTSQGVDWKAKARDNLYALSRDTPYNGYWARANTDRYVVSLLHDDAMGPSRLLTPNLLNERWGTTTRWRFPNVPARSPIGIHCPRQSLNLPMPLSKNVF